MFELVNVVMKLIADIIVFVLKFFERLFKADIVLTLFIIVALVAGMMFNIVGVYWTLLFILIAEFGYSAYKGDTINIVDDHIMLIESIKGFVRKQASSRVQPPVNNHYPVEKPPIITANNQPSEPNINIQPQPLINVQEPQPPYTPQPPMQPPAQPPIQSQSITPGFKINRKSSSWTNKGREENAIVDLENLLKERIKSQGVAIKAVIDGLKRAAINNNRNTKLNFLLTGPTGTGKTEMVKLAADGLKRPFKKYDMGNYKDKEQLWQLLGSPQGYIGGEGKLTQFVKNNPNACLLFDEVEKATSEIYDFMLPMLDDGKVRDTRTDEVIDFSKTMIFFTTNLVTNTPPEARENPEVVRDLILDKGFLRQELIGRIKNIVPFFEFQEEDILEIVGIQLKTYVESIVDPNRVSISCDDDVIEFVGAKIDKKYGARNIAQNIERHIGNNLTDQLFQRGQTPSRVRILVENEAIKVEVE